MNSRHRESLLLYSLATKAYNATIAATEKASHAVRKLPPRGTVLESWGRLPDGPSP